jgi:hypothetical protein
MHTSFSEGFVTFNFYRVVKGLKISWTPPFRLRKIRSSKY